MVKNSSIFTQLNILDLPCGQSCSKRAIHLRASLYLCGVLYTQQTAASIAHKNRNKKEASCRARYSQYPPPSPKLTILIKAQVNQMKTLFFRWKLMILEVWPFDLKTSWFPNSVQLLLNFHVNRMKTDCFSDWNWWF